ncbi:TPA: transporter substrate-binding domain-containing protein [Burkholderia cenocepacia]|uniref:ABC transporter substrate-binding protein n=1 Tax=Burkholderia latens TaxID=488446 RepID=A0A6H9T5E7_9BURK|nr:MULTISPECIES: transporter substrate-binding domain-containing protein [Burkholderia]KAB0644520.1 transporter substrate-binding domain-containing protein [Burkholderia latens]MBJ9923929.1 transporter substrate-binding domain-containing protein [Burkholderia cenocepacia]UJH78765.1 transporter substrate-binding domain-containing protein [Burkholderia cenocepacia]VWB24132.1 ABC transporter substrate-binding protein [Burkholderia latens]HDR9879672.1 transporter substrate-binding domain-containin
MKWSFLSLLMGAAVLVSTYAPAQAATLSVGTEGDAPPFSMADASGNVTGYDADVASAICTELKMQCKFVVQSFNTLIPSLSAGEFDVVISGLGITDARKKQIDFSIPYAGVTKYFAVKKGSPLLQATSLDAIGKALDGKSVGVVNGTTYAKYVAKHFANADIKSYDSVNQMVSDLKSGRLYAAFSDSPTWADVMKTPSGAAITRVPVAVRQKEDPEILGTGMGVGIRKGNAEFKKRVDTALCTLIKDGTMKKISIKWFQEDYTIPCAP